MTNEKGCEVATSTMRLWHRFRREIGRFCTGEKSWSVPVFRSSLLRVALALSLVMSLAACARPSLSDASHADMVLGITGIGWGLYVVAYIPLALGLPIIFSGPVWLFSKSRRLSLLAHAIVATPLVLYPVLEAQYSQWQMRRACPSATGLVVHERVTVDGYFDATDQGNYLNPETNSHLLEEMIKVGYRYREFYDIYRKQYIRIDRGVDGLSEMQLEGPASRYRLTKAERHVIGLHVIKNEQHILDSESGVPIASEASVHRTPSFIDRLWLGFFGSFEGIEGCPRDATQTLNSLAVRQRILIPAGRTN